MWTFPYYIPGQLPDWQALERRFSWFADMKNVPQDPEWHAEGDVFTHTKMVCEALLKLPEFQALDEQEQHILFAAAMLHDVEKRSTTKREIENGKERIVSPHHAKKRRTYRPYFAVYRTCRTVCRARSDSQTRASARAAFMGN